MTKNVYSIRDVKSVWMNPFVDDNDEIARRGFCYAIASKPDIIGFSPKDFALYRIGTFCTHNGKMESCIPVLICEATDALSEVTTDA